MQIITKQKILLASLLYHLVAFIRGLLNLKSCVEVKRDGINYKLDLKEGIDFAIYLFGVYERKSFKAYQKIIKKGDTVFDIGANIGGHTMQLARLTGENGRLYAFEPTDFSFDKLKDNIELNPELAKNVTLSQIMLTDSNSEKPDPEIYSSWPLVGGLNKHPKHCGQLKSTSGSSAMTLDEFVIKEKIDRVDFIKMDVDGNEIRVLRGASNVLEKFKPTFIFEIAPYALAEAGFSIDELLDIFTKMGYSLHHEGSNTPLPQDIKSIIPDGASCNAIAYVEK
ncbi:MAG: FkbM family methyltransferase [Magnetococcales bacterium]|nr:FkbM family methyltransferase [Magnetococcales bacterium]